MASKQRNPVRFTWQRVLGLVLTILFLVSLFIPTPYYLYQPGSADELAPRVKVANGHKDEKGSLMLTTVLSIPASNIYYLAYGKLAPHTEIKKEEEVKQGLSDDEYERLLEHMMTSSEQNAIIAGLTAAGEKVTTHFSGVFVSMILPDSKAKNVLHVGDVITAVDGLKLDKAEDMTSYLTKNKKAGDHVKVTYLHGKQTSTSDIQLVELGANNQTTPGVPKKPGLGIVPENEFTLDTSRKVTISADDIGGPSAGLMFSLEIYSQIMPGDLTKGYKIAGTGTIDSKGNVGQIGGIEHKIIAANNKGAEIFFCPADIEDGDSNYRDLVAAAKTEGLDKKIKIVPVKTMQDALAYLQKL
ncbi:MAG: SepM family pheromone-processing serine protease, partial [Tumebacillaceae bacterium]